MTGISDALQRDSQHLLGRASFLVVLALLAILVPDHFFYNALLGVSAVSIAFGLYEMTIRGERERGRPRYELLPVLSGATSVCFGIVSVGLVFANFDTAVAMTASWFLLQAVGLAVAATVLKSHFLPRVALASLAAVHAAVGGIVFLMPIHPRISSLAIPIVGTLYAASYGVWQGVAGLWLRQLAKQLPTAEASGNSGRAFETQRGGVPHVVVALLAILSGCAPVLSNTPVDGDRTTIEQLVGQWEGVYNSGETGRSGIITFRLRAGTDTAQGDVLMVPREDRTHNNYDEADPNRQRLRPAQLITIRFVVAIGGEVRGVLDPYPDPECGCTLITRFRGRLRGDEIKGTYESQSAGIFHKPASGDWSVKRTVVKAASNPTEPKR